MKINQLIVALQRIASEHGDIEVQKQLRGTAQSVPVGRPMLQDEPASRGWLSHGSVFNPTTRRADKVVVL